MSSTSQRSVRISIIIPVLNEALTLATPLRALQLFRPTAEIIVIDGGSHDATMAIAQPFADHVLRSTTGRAQQMNTGADIAQADVLLFLHADTYLPSDALTHIHAAMDTGREWGRFDIDLDSPHLLLKLVSVTMNLRSRLTGIATGDQGIFVSRRAFAAVNQYTAQALMEDIDLSRKLRHISAPSCLRSKVRSSARRWEQFGILKTILLMWSLRLRYFCGASPDILARCYREGRFWTP